MLFNQFAANATGMEVIAGPAEATALGNIILQAITLGNVKDHADGRRIIRESMDVEVFQPQDASTWETAYKQFSKFGA